MEEADKSEKGRDLMKKGNNQIEPERCFQGICTTVYLGTKEQLDKVGKEEKIKQEGEINQKDKISQEEEQDKRVLISEIIIEGLEDHPDRERLEVAAYDSMLIRPGSKVTSEDLQKDLDRI